jgi:hypothetical protein
MMMTKNFPHDRGRRSIGPSQRSDELGTSSRAGFKLSAVEAAQILAR